MDVMPYLTNASEGSILFIDEIHRLPKPVEEFIYPVMEDFRVDVVLGEGMSARTINLPLKKFTIIGATTRSGMLSGPLRDRFHMHEHLEYYDVDDLAKIVSVNAAKLKTTITEEAAWELARRSRGTPRLANSRLRWVRDFATARADGQHQPDHRRRRPGHAGHRRRRHGPPGPPLPRDPDPGLQGAARPAPRPSPRP